jgi:ATP-binding cassette subfamily B protein
MLEAALSVALVARQLGFQIPADRVESGFESGELASERRLVEFFDRMGVVARYRSARVRDLETRAYLFPCVALMKSGRAVVLAGCKAGTREAPAALSGVDPSDPSGKPFSLALDSFRAAWSGRLILVARKTGEEAKDRFFGWSWLVPEVVRFKWLLLIVLVISLILHALAFAPILFIQIALDKVIGYKATSTLYVLTAGVLLALVFGGVLGYIRDYIIRFVVTSVEARLAGDVFDKLLGLPVHAFHGGGAGDLEAGVLGGVPVRNFLANQVLGGLFDLTALLIFLPILFAYSAPLALLVIAFAVAMGAASLAFKSLEKTLSRRVGGKGGDKIRVLRETIRGIDAVKTLSQEVSQRRAWRRSAAAAIRAQGERERISAAATQVNNVLQQTMTVAVIFTGIQLVFGGSMSAGALIAVNMIGARVVRPIVQAISGIADFERARAAKEQLARIWNAAPERRGFGVQRGVLGRFQLAGVSVVYGNGVRALDGVSLVVEPRRMVAVVGPGGAGKSTFMRLLQGLVRATEGTLEVDGTPFASLDLETYRRQVALVTTRPRFFAGTIEDNLRRVRPNVSERELEEALKLSGFAQVVHDLPDGLATSIDDEAASLPDSVGELLALARALVVNPKVLLLDDVYTALDKDGQLAFRRNLPAMAAQRGLLVVTQDLVLASAFDAIVVLEKGRLQGYDAHARLLDSCATYKRLWDMEQQLLMPTRKAAE